MISNNNKTNRLFSFFSAIEENNTTDDFKYTLAILKKTLDLQKKSFDKNLNSSYLNDDEVYDLMKKVSSYFCVNNPFPNKDNFYNIYRTLRNFDNITWADIIEYSNLKSKFIVPEILINEIEKKFSDKCSEVLIPEAEKFSLSLERLLESHSEVHFTLTTTDNFYFKILKEMFSNKSNVDIKQMNIYEYEFSSKKFDFIMAVPVFGIRDKANEQSPFICREYDMIALENLALHLQSDGILSIVLPARITFSGGKVKELRDFIQSMYCLKEISELPTGIFKNTAIKTFLLTITTGRTDEVIIKRYVSDSDNPYKRQINKLIIQDETFVLEDELLDMGNWNIDRIFESQDEDWIKFQESNVKKQELGTVATIFRGKYVSHKNPTGNIGVINISNIGEYEVDYSNLDYLEDEEININKYILKDGDLLIPARGTVIRVAIFKEQAYPCIASSNVVVIRSTDESLSTTYLKLFLDTPLGRKMLITRQQGTSLMNISYKELNNIDIPLPSVEEQKQISEIYTKELKIYKKTIQEAENRWSSVLSKLQSRI